MLEILIKKPSTSEPEQMRNFIFLRKCFLQKNMYHDGSSYVIQRQTTRLLDNNALIKVSMGASRVVF